MIYILKATITAPDGNEVIKFMKFEGNSRDDILDKIECPEHHKANLRHHGRAGFKDQYGTKHRWQLIKHKDD